MFKYPFCKDDVAIGMTHYVPPKQIITDAERKALYAGQRYDRFKGVEIVQREVPFCERFQRSNSTASAAAEAM